MKKFSLNLLKVGVLLVICLFIITLTNEVKAAKLTIDYNGGADEFGNTSATLYDGNNDNAYTIPASNKANVVNGNSYKKVTIKKDGFVFDGWSTEKLTNYADLTKEYNQKSKYFTIKEDTTIYPVWVPIAEPVKDEKPVQESVEKPVQESVEKPVQESTKKTTSGSFISQIFGWIMNILTNIIIPMMRNIVPKIGAAIGSMVK